MIKINQTKNYECTLEALAINDSLNSEHKKNNETFDKGNKKY
jgi:hypothetical protein